MPLPPLLAAASPILGKAADSAVDGLFGKDIYGGAQPMADQARADGGTATGGYAIGGTLGSPFNVVGSPAATIAGSLGEATTSPNNIPFFTVAVIAAIALWMMAVVGRRK